MIEDKSERVAQQTIAEMRKLPPIKNQVVSLAIN